MIDLTKPIRRKSDHAVVAMVSEITSYYVEPRDDPQTYKLSLAELEAIYENIPEPRMPREYWAIMPGIDDMRPGGYFVDKGDSAGAMHLIEWPADAPLPEWPT